LCWQLASVCTFLLLTSHLPLALLLALFLLLQVVGLALEFEGAPLRMERKQHYLARKIAERKAKKLGTSAEVGAPVHSSDMVWLHYMHTRVRSCHSLICVAQLLMLAARYATAEPYNIRMQSTFMLRTSPRACLATAAALLWLPTCLLCCCRS
jgi:hypothetical protein